MSLTVFKKIVVNKGPVLDTFNNVFPLGHRSQKCPKHDPLYIIHTWILTYRKALLLVYEI